MIRNEEELKMTRKQLERVEAALAALRVRVHPLNPQRFGLMAEGFVYQIRNLRGEIDEYLGVSEAQAAQVDLLLRLIGPRVHLGSVPTSVVTQMLDQLRQSLAAIGNRVRSGPSWRPGRRHPILEALCDPSIVSWEAGSVRLGLDLPIYVQPSLPGVPGSVEADVAQAAGLLVDGLAVGATGAIPASLKDEDLRRFVLGRVIKLAPSGRGPLAALEVSGRLVQAPEPYRLDSRSRTRIRKEMLRPAPGQVTTEEGTVREIDLDRLSFDLRERPDGREQLRCDFPLELLEEAKAALGQWVLITGTLSRDPTTGKEKSISVHLIEEAAQGELQP